MRPYVIINNLVMLIWFICLQYFRFKDTGRACAGEFIGKTIPGNYGTLYLPTFGAWIKWFIIIHYTVYILSKCVSIIVTNKLEA